MMANKAAAVAIANPAAQYTVRFRARSQAARTLYRHMRRLVLAKRIYLGSVIGYAVFDPTMAFIVLPMLISLLPVVWIQHRMFQLWSQNDRAAAFYRRALDRIEGTWAGQGDTGQPYRDANHRYTNDLDIFGPGSLFELLCTARTAAGRDTLADWLQDAADAPTVLARQNAVRELMDQLDLRERLDGAGDGLRKFDLQPVQAAAEAKPVMGTGGSGSWLLRALVASFGWTWLLSGVMAWNRGGDWELFFLAGLACEAAAYFALRSRLLVVCEHGDEVGASLASVARFTMVMSAARPDSKILRNHRERLCASPRPLSPGHPMAIGLILQLPFIYFLAIELIPGLERWWLDRIARLSERWELIGEIEALASLAAHAHEHPSDCFPELVTTQTCLIATQLGHPLIPASRCVRNDVKLAGDLRMLMVSGSNMSGKSTLLRTVGINSVLALAGATVRASSLRISPLQVATAMRFQDSLESGTSYFYAVLCRLRMVLDLLREPRPVLFLLDEILQGTNSHDRLVGAEAVVRRLLASDAVGLVTTHDLELTRLVNHMPAAANVHFVDEVVGGQLTFDYRMRSGVVQSSNALALMRSMGLDV